MPVLKRITCHTLQHPPRGVIDIMSQQTVRIALLPPRSRECHVFHPLERFNVGAVACLDSQAAAAAPAAARMRRSRPRSLLSERLASLGYNSDAHSLGRSSTGSLSGWLASSSAAASPRGEQKSGVFGGAAAGARFGMPRPASAGNLLAVGGSPADNRFGMPRPASAGNLLALGAAPAGAGPPDAPPLHQQPQPDGRAARTVRVATVPLLQALPRNFRCCPPLTDAAKARPGNAPTRGWQT